ncbi:hypothetical protein J8I87_43380 [Paraburkholderia sp. LEh10]|uniref:hypothetical protein n=1 Tax=Paraburkholderia sp. LEh10 TaxID=2821353 RepID=UPI001AE6961E|nr:hypothetical protein [Paraburkholderia sp. LEh10]MBP0596307.1 hypothetical protein [Paraburkholderia sp. LEh10]
MTRSDLLDRIRRDRSGIVERFLPVDVCAELESVVRDGRHEVNADALMMFMSIRALLREDGMASCESDGEASQIMALLNA